MIHEPRNCDGQRKSLSERGEDKPRVNGRSMCERHEQSNKNTCCFSTPKRIPLPRSGVLLRMLSLLNNGMQAAAASFSWTQ